MLCLTVLILYYVHVPEISDRNVKKCCPGKPVIFPFTTRWSSEQNFCSAGHIAKKKKDIYGSLQSATATNVSKNETDYFGRPTPLCTLQYYTPLTTILHFLSTHKIKAQTENRY